MPLWYNVCDWPLRSGQLAFWFTVPELKPHLWKMCNVKNGWNESIQKYDTEFTVLKYIVCAVKIFCHVWCCSAHEDIICMATALFQIQIWIYLKKSRFLVWKLFHSKVHWLAGWWLHRRNVWRCFAHEIWIYTLLRYLTLYNLLKSGFLPNIWIFGLENVPMYCA